jgi:multiple sugar transport system ATP-binding protein
LVALPGGIGLTTVTLEKVSKRYGNVEVINGLDLAIEEGEFVVLLGPSGCGKSTLLRMLAGLEEITGGTIRIGGDIVNNMPARDRSVAMVFQNYALYPHMTVAQNMGFALKMRGVDANDIDGRVQDAAKILGLSDLLDRHPRALSGGQRQRVAMGRAIVRDPKVFLFDEPLSNLDAKLRAKMRVEIEELHRRIRATSVFVTHDQVEAMTMADRIVLMNGGVIQQAGTPVELYDSPANLFVADFIGSPAMNQVAGELTINDTGAVLRFGHGGEIRLDATLSPYEGSLTCGFRPEHTELSKSASGSATVTAVENLGHEVLVHCKLGTEHLTALMSRTDTSHFEIGEAVEIAPRPGSVHLFDVKSGKRQN